MRVCRLIELLQKLPPDAFVLVEDSEYGSFPGSIPYISEDDFYIEPVRKHGIREAVCLISVREWQQEDES